MPPVKQYVNLPLNADKRHGNKIAYKVKATEPDGTTPAPGRDMVWILEPDGGNTDKKYLSAKQRAKLEKPETTSDSQAWCTNTLTLPHVGGDKYKVKVHRKGDDPGTARLVEEVETWRKIYITVHYLEAKGRKLYNDLKGRLKSSFTPGFVEFEEVSVAPTPNVEADTVATSSELQHLYGTNYPLEFKPWHLRIVIVKQVYSANTASLVAVVQHDTAEASKTVRKVGDHYEVDLTTPDDMHGDDPVKNATATAYAKEAGAWKARGEPINIKAGVTKTGARALKVDLTAHAVQLNQAMEKYANAKVFKDGKFEKKFQDGAVRISLSYNKAGQGDLYNGHSRGNFCCVRTDRKDNLGNDLPDDQIQSAVLGTFAHEIGHGLQQAVKEEPLYDDAGAAKTGADAVEKNYTESGGHIQGPWHTNNYGGQGPHCATNAKLANAGTTSGKTFVWDDTKPKLCTMYYAGVADRNNGWFCATCVPRLKRADLSRFNMFAKDWNLF